MSATRSCVTSTSRRWASAFGSEPGIEVCEGSKQPTEWKLYNVVTIQKFKRNGRQIDQRTGARYGSGVTFTEHVRQAARKMGRLSADRVAFVADGLPTNWQIQMDYFPGAICILDFLATARQ